MFPEQRISTESIYDGRVVRVRVDTVRLPNGRQTSREVVGHGASVVLIPVDDHGNVLLVRQFRYPVGEALLEAPAGGVEAPETPAECAERELQEETGYACRDLRAVGNFWMSPGYCDELMYAFLAKDLVPSRLKADDDEAIQVERVPLARVPELVRSGEIRDAKTIASLLMVMCLLNHD